MKPVRFALLRGICQTPAYVAIEKGFLAEAGIEAWGRFSWPVWTCAPRIEPAPVKIR